MKKILIVYNSIIHNIEGDEQINAIISKIDSIFKSDDEIDIVIPQKIIPLMMKNVYFKGKVKNIFSIYKDEYVNYKDYVNDITEVMKYNEYKYIFIPSGGCDKAISAKISSMLSAGVTVDVVDMILKKRMLYIRVTSSNELLAYIECKGKTQIATTKLPLNTQNTDNLNGLYNYNEIKIYPVCPNSKRSKIVFEDYKIYNTTSKIVFGIGRGVDRSALEKIKKIANANDIEIVSTKPCVEKGLFNFSSQVGQSGKSIRSKLYIAIGISGAMQHLIGVMDCEKIIAINPDKNAPIHNFADISILLNIEDVLARYEKEWNLS